MAATTETVADPAPGAGVDGVVEHADTTHADADAGRVAAVETPRRERSPVAVKHSQFRTVDSQVIRRFFASVYRPGWRVSELTASAAVSHRRCEAGFLTVDDVTIQGRAVVEIPASSTAVVIQPRAGSLSVVGGPSATLDVPLLVTHGMSCVLQCNGARFDVVSLAADVLHKVAADWQGALPQQIQFLDRRPRSSAAVRAWQRALEYVTAGLAAADTAQQPMIVTGMARLLAAALLECYPSNVTDQDPDDEAALPETLKEAVSFIHRHAAGEVGINEVAAAVHLTPRAVQYLFRRQLGTTPTEYMRRVRLNRAHQELISGSPTTAKVTEIAQRWGFAHTGRFAVLYRQTYGQSPHSTLRQQTEPS